MSNIKIKRGNKAGLPLLLDGELAFVKDTKELYIGVDGAYNYNLTQSNNNLIINGNFFYPLTNADKSNNINIGVNTATYYYGNFYFSNPSTSIGNVNVTRAPNQTSLRITSTTAKPSIEYRYKLVKTLSGANTVYTAPFIDGTMLTLSFDYQNTGATAIDFECGCPNNLVSSQLPANSSGRIAVSFPFYKYTLASLGYPIFDVFIFKPGSNFTASIDIGNVKLEIGNRATAFEPSVTARDIITLRQSYFEKTFYNRPEIITLNGADLYFDFIPNDNTIYSPSVTVSTVSVYSLLGISVSGFTPTVTVDANNLIKLSLSKLAHGLTDLSATGTLYCDNRPY